MAWPETGRSPSEGLDFSPKHRASSLTGSRAESHVGLIDRSQSSSFFSSLPNVEVDLVALHRP